MRQTQILGADLAKFLIRSDNINLSANSAFFAYDTEIHGQFFTPNDSIDLGGRNVFYGRFVAKEISGDGPYDVFLAAPAKKWGTKFNDLNANGQRDAGEPGLGGWTIYVGYDDDGSLDAREPSDVTDANGDYQITGIKPGTYAGGTAQPAFQPRPRSGRPALMWSQNS